MSRFFTNINHDDVRRHDSTVHYSFYDDVRRHDSSKVVKVSKNKKENNKILLNITILLNYLNYLNGSGEDRGNPHQHDFEILHCKVNPRS